MFTIWAFPPQDRQHGRADPFDEMKKRNWPIDETALCVVTFDELDTARERTDGAIEAIIAAGFPKEKIFKAPQKTSDVEGSLDAVTVLLTQHRM